MDVTNWARRFQAAMESRLDGALGLNAKALEQASARMAQLERRFNEKEQYERQLKIITTSYSTATAYTNTIVIAGYAGFFAIWSFNRYLISDTQALLSGLLMMFSLTVFVLFELYKMIWQQLYFQRRSAQLVKHDPLGALKAFDEATQVGVAHFIRIWMTVLLLTIIPGAIAVAIMGYAFLLRLLRSAGLL